MARRVTTKQFLPPSWPRSSQLSQSSAAPTPKATRKEEQGIYEIDDAKCKMGIVDIKLDRDFMLLLISRF